MGVKIRKIHGKWYVQIDYRGHRKTKVIGHSRKVAEDVRRRIEARLAMGDMGVFGQDAEMPTFEIYAESWLKDHAQRECKRSTYRSYEQLLRVHVTPRFGSKRLNEIKRESIKRFLGDITTATKISNPETGETELRFSRNTLRLIVCALRAVLNAAVEDGLIESNPASRIGRFARTERPSNEASAMNREEVDAFLTAVQEVCSDWYPLFLTAVRAGLRKGELIALQWGDIQFGKNENDPNRFILVQRNYSLGEFTTPKSKKSRRVDMSRQLRAVLLKLRDERLLAAYLKGKSSINGDLVFPSQADTPIAPDNIAVRYMQPALAKAGLREFRFHDLRHTFGSLLIRDGASLAYVKEQMGHSSVQITVDTYGHLIPGADISWVDRLDLVPETEQAVPQTSANQTQTRDETEMEQNAEVIESVWLPPRDSNPDMLIQRLMTHAV